jgi:hypothetical protein
MANGTAHNGLLNGLGFIALGGDDSGLKLPQSGDESVATQSVDLEILEPNDYLSIGPHSSSSSWSMESESEQSSGENRVFIQPNGVEIDSDLVYDQQRLTFNELSRITRQGLDFPAKGLENIGNNLASMKRQMPLAKIQHATAKRMAERKRKVLLISTNHQAKQKSASDNGYAGDIGSNTIVDLSNSSIGNPVYVRSNMPLSLKMALSETTRFCIFNTDRLTASEAWHILKQHLTPDILDGLTQVKSIRQPNGNPRIDFWLEKCVAGDVSRSLYMCSKDRRQGVKVDHHVPLYKLKDLWIPNAATKQWRLDFWRPWRDLQLHRSYEIRPPTTMQNKTSIVTLNVNGFVGKRPELLNFLSGAKWVL